MSVTDYLMYQRAKEAYFAARQRLLGEPVYLDRVMLDKETARIMARLPLADMTALEVSGNKWMSSDFRSYMSVSYPKYDLCDEPLDMTFDVIIAEQVFEHLLWPHRAARNVYRMLRPAGYFLITVPFLQKVHYQPHDCTRWTETGIKYLLADCGFNLDAIQTWSWGNRAAVKANLIPKEWKFPIYNPLRHHMRNEKLFPVQVSALARKSAV